MRPLLLSVGLWGLALASGAQSSSGTGGNMPQIPFGQTYKNFQFPIYQNNQLSYTLAALTATGETINRAATTDLKIEIYTAGKVTTTITSPKADIYVNERIMRTKNTVKVDRADLTATSQSCDFDLITKKYLMRENVHVLLKNFDAGSAAKRPGPPGTPASHSVVPGSVPSPAPQAEEATPTPSTQASRNSDSLLEMPGAYANTNTAPANP